MQEVNTFLTDLQNKLILSNTEKTRIDSSFQTLKTKIWGLFQQDLLNVELFGSYDRDTLINKEKDPDVDVMIVFRENKYQPQTYLDKLKNFGEKYYPRSDIYPDHPTIVIEMSQIKFELVPAYPSTLGGFKIPAPKRKDVSWISTNPKSFKDKLISKDKTNKNLILPLIRILKYWNTLNDKLYDSFEIEKQIVGLEYINCKLLIEYFYTGYHVFNGLSQTNEQKLANKKLREIVNNVKILTREKFTDYSVMEIQKLFSS